MELPKFVIKYLDVYKKSHTIDTYDEKRLFPEITDNTYPSSRNDKTKVVIIKKKIIVRQKAFIALLKSRQDFKICRFPHFPCIRCCI